MNLDEPLFIIMDGLGFGLLLLSLFLSLINGFLFKLIYNICIISSLFIFITSLSIIIHRHKNDILLIHKTYIYIILLIIILIITILLIGNFFLREINNNCCIYVPFINIFQTLIKIKNYIIYFYIICIGLFIIFISQALFNTPCVFKNKSSKCYSINQYREMSNKEKDELTTDDELRQKLNSCICPNMSDSPSTINNCLSKNDCNNNQVYKFKLNISLTLAMVILSFIILFYFRDELMLLLKYLKKSNLNNYIRAGIIFFILLLLTILSILNLNTFVNISDNDGD